MTPSDWFARRPSTDDGYYECFNQENVFAVDVGKNLIVAITPEGIQTNDGVVHDADLIVFATGFDVIDGSYNAIDIKGRDGQTLKQHWIDAPKAQLGVTTFQFPNLLFVNGPGVPLANISAVAEVSARLVADLIAHVEKLRNNGDERAIVESTNEADGRWLQEATAIGQATLFKRIPSWIFGDNIPGKSIAPRFHLLGLANYCSVIATLKANTFPGFKFQNDVGLDSNK